MHAGSRNKIRVYFQAGLSAAALFLTAMAGWSCQTTKRGVEDTTSFGLSDVPAAPVSAEKPIRLLIGVNETYCQKTACSCVSDQARRDLEPLGNMLREQKGIELEWRYYPGDTFTLQKDLREGKLDGALCKPWVILQTARTSGKDFRRVADLQTPQGNGQLHGVFLVRTDSPIRSLADLAGKRLAIGKSDNYEKHHAALTLLRQNGIDPGSVTLLEYSSCLESVGEVMEGKADAAVISDYAFDVDCLVDIAKKDQFRELARTVPVPSTSLLLDIAKVDPMQAKQVQDALVSVSAGGSLREPLMGRGFVRPVFWSPDELPEVSSGACIIAPCCPQAK